ncbi:MAG: 1,2-phenylacetyl-CoA epoxidase subunit PaaC [Hyphomicrobiaceae bacterium]|nr:1,2-phenylacetyl-CoA epoxidase subunit PaaC [Hyphomicrobiaceae bacterium]
MPGSDQHAHLDYLLRLADTSLILGHRLSEWSGRAPTLEEDIALSNIALDLIGQARPLYARAASLEGKGRSEDDLAFLRDPEEYLNLQIVERPNKDFAATMARQLAYSTFAELAWQQLKGSQDPDIAGVAAKAEKECAYHVRHSAEWVIRLGDGTEESHARMQAGLDDVWMYTGEMFEVDDVDTAMIAAGIGFDAAALKPQWARAMAEVIGEATLRLPGERWMSTGGRRGIHTEHLGHLLAQMQALPRAHPGASW